MAAGDAPAPAGYLGRTCGQGDPPTHAAAHRAGAAQSFENVKEVGTGERKGRGAERRGGRHVTGCADAAPPRRGRPGSSSAGAVAGAGAAARAWRSGAWRSRAWRVLGLLVALLGFAATRALAAKPPSVVIDAAAAAGTVLRFTFTEGDATLPISSGALVAGTARTDIARRVIGCHVTQETRVQSACR